MNNKTLNRDDKIKLYLEGAKKIFPNLNTTSVFSMYGSAEPMSGNIELNDSFINEVLLEKGNLCFIHYTSLKSAMNILNSGKVRLYNCHNLNDPSEINYLLENCPIDFSSKEVEDYKREHFFLSGSIYNSEQDEDFNLWRLYGDEGRGVGLVFEIDHRIKNWVSTYLQKIHYGTKNKKANQIIELFSYHKEFNDKYALFENTPRLFSLLATSIKNDIWSIENEFRVVCKISFDKHSLEAKEDIKNNHLIKISLAHEHKQSGQMVSYVELPLHLNDYKSNRIKSPLRNEIIDTINYVPNLKIKKLILGPNNVLKKKSDILDYASWVSKKMNYQFDIELSSIDF